MTIRLKVTVGLIVVLLMANSVLSLVIVVHRGHLWLTEVQNRVRLDLNSARASYDNYVQGIGRFLQAMSLDEGVATALRQEDRGKLGSLLRTAQRTGGMDVLSVLDGEGRVICRAQNPEDQGDGLSRNPIVARVLKEQRLVTGTIIVSAESLAEESPELAERARFELLPTPQARRTTDRVRTDGMVLAAAVPILDSEGRLLGVLYAGDLLNRRYEIVDSIKDEVFFGKVYEGREIGTVTIFQGDLRISTNVRDTDGSRAVGTRLSTQVAEEVLDRDGVWAAPAFVVNDWYITAYEPIRDPDDQIIGVLYVGLLRAPFLHRLRVLLNLLLNACEAMPNGGTLTVSTRSRDGMVLVKLADTGCGIKQARLEQIFEPFFSTKAIGKGTGLSLSVSYGIIQQHGGDLQVESQEGEGSTFTILLPSAEQRPPDGP